MTYLNPKFVYLALMLIASNGFIFAADPQVSSWYTENSGQYARIYETLNDQNSGNAVSTWSRGQGTQTLPTYAGIHEVSYSNDWVYIRTTNLASYIMGPWYLDGAKSNLFPNYPANRAVLYRFPRSPSASNNKTLTGLGAIGYFVDGVAMFDNRDAFSYSNSNASDARPNTNFNGDAIWNRDAYVNESVTFDAGNAHQAGSSYHYHANPPGLRFLLGDQVDYDSASNTYSENASNPSHSPIIGWVRDGYPIYGPYGYDDPNDASSQVRRMISGYQKRDGSNGTIDLNATGRTTLPAWAVTAQGRPSILSNNQYGPDVGMTNYTLGHYIEDYAYKGNFGMTQGSDFDLDLYNGRFCKTPEYPEGTYAYFITIEDDGTPEFPYNIGRWYYGAPNGASINAINETVDKYFEGGPEKPLTTDSIAQDATSGDVTVTWDVIEGGSYELSDSSDLAYWKLAEDSITADSGKAEVSVTNLPSDESKGFYKLNQTALADFDSNGFDYSTQNYTILSTVTLTLSSDSATTTATAPADLSVDPTSITLAGNPIIYLGRPAQNQIQFRVDLEALSDGNYPLQVDFNGISERFTANLSVGTPPIDTGNNILLIIVDDWGYDWSPVHNSASGITLPNMPTLQSLASTGLQFNRAYAQPICSPTRATILTGRQPFRHGVGDPVTNNVLPSSELTLPEIFTQESSSYALASFGKWHLGSGATGPKVTGGWDYFKGILQGGVTDYFNWTKTEVINGTALSTTSTNYTTTDQIDDAVSWIDNQSGPWFCWLALNAPHTPFHEPPANLAPSTGGYTNPSDTSNTGLYCRTLEAMDTEIGRLLQNIDLANTNIIIIGDNGSPGQVAQAPYGNGHAKASLYEGGIHVPLVISGPDVTTSSGAGAGLGAGASSDTLVHCVDLFSTILQLAGINQSTATSSVDVIDSNSLIPILSNSDSSTRTVVAEKFGNTVGSGRALLSADYPEFKLIINGDPLSSSDNPSYEFYNISQDTNEQSPLNTGALNASETLAYDFFIAMDANLGGGYSDPSEGSATDVIIYLELINNNPNRLPDLLRQDGVAKHPEGVTVGGINAVFDTNELSDGYPASRVDSNGASNRFFLKVTFDPVAAGLNTGDYPMVVTFRGPNNTTLTCNATNTFTYTAP